MRSLDLLDAGLEVRLGLDQVEQADALLPLDDGADRPVLEADHLGDLGKRADRVDLVDAVDLFGLVAALGDERHRRARAHRAVERLHAPVATDLQRHDHLGEDDGVAQGHHRQHLDVVDVSRRVAGRLRLVVSHDVTVADFGFHESHFPSVEAGHRFGLVALDVSLDIICIEQVVDADLAERLELKDDLDARQVDPLALGQEADDTHPPDIRLGVETELVAPLRADEAFFLVDPQRTRMDARQLGGDADEVHQADRPGGEPSRGDRPPTDR